MGLTSGTKLGPYEIQCPLGAGGMGEVYRALDTRLDRTVAIKILPGHLSDNPEAKQRFEREARTISSLNHPNICTLHDVGSQDGTSYLVMEYVQGETLEARLQKGPLPLKQALETGVQICVALEKAHRAGIVHRDLKPGNIMLTPSGVKLLDFGLAKPAAAMLGAQPFPSKGSDHGTLTPSTPTINLSMLSATPAPLTQQGTIVGTFQYMPPEVIQGSEADARSDIFSFGCVFYEMITGRRAFDGKSQLTVLSSILEKEPEPISKLLPLTPPALDHVVRECLAKDPDARWQNASDLARELRWIASDGSSPAGSGGAAVAHNPRRERVLWAVLATGLVAVLLWLAFRGHDAPRVFRSYLPPPPDASFDFTGDFSGPPALTRSGTAVAFCAHSKKEVNSIWIQSFSELAARKIEGTEGASFPFWSYDEKFVGFFADGHLKKVAASGGPVITLADTPNARGGSWSQDNVIIYEPDYRDSLWRINAAGGTPERLTKFDQGNHTTHRWPRFLPDGKHFLFFATNHSGGSEQGIYFGSLSDGSYKRVVVDTDSDAQFASGYLLYHSQAALMAQKFDPASGTVSGDPILAASQLEYDVGTWHSTFAASENGILVYEPGAKALGTDIVWIDRTGKQVGRVGDRAFYKGGGSISPDGKRLAVSMGDPQADIWVFDLERGSRTRLTFGGGTHLEPSWSADGKRVAYLRQNGPLLSMGTSICARLANGGGQEEVLMDRAPASPTLLSPQWSPDGRYLLHMETSGPTGAGVWAMPTTGDKKPFPIVQPPNFQARIAQFRLSPDGRWLAYSSTETGREEVYVTHFPSGAGKWQVSQTGGTFPAWRGDSGEIFYGGLDTSIHAVPVDKNTDEFQTQTGQVLFSMGFIAPIGYPYDVSPDGQRFVINSSVENVSVPLVVVANWTADLKK